MDDIDLRLSDGLEVDTGERMVLQEDFWISLCIRESILAWKAN